MPFINRASTNTTRPPRHMRGAAYVVALLITTILAAMVLVFAREMRVEADMATQRSRSTEARWIAMGALEAVRGDLARVIALGEAPRLDSVSPEAEQLGGGLFWLIKPNPDSDEEPAFGLIGEAGKINLALLAPQGGGGGGGGGGGNDTPPPPDLLELPGMSEDLIAAIVDWQDRNDTVSPGGAESSYYLSRETPYNIKNRPLETVGEMLYIRGVTAELYYGEDANLNGVLDPNEDDGDDTAPNDNADGKLDRGLIDYFTVYSVDPNLSHSGEEKASVDVVNPGSQDNQAFVQLFRAQFGEERGNELIQKTASEGKPFASLLDYFNRVEMTDDEFELVHDQLKRVDNDEEITGLIDVYNTLPEVLDTLPGLEPGDGQLIVDARPTFQQGEPIRNISWLVDVLGAEKAATVGRYLTHRSCQFTADIVAVTGDGRSFCRLRVVLDCTPVLEGDATLPRVVYLQDLTSLGWPLPEEVRDELRRGTNPADISTVYNSGSY